MRRPPDGFTPPNARAISARLSSGRHFPQQPPGPPPSLLPYRSLSRAAVDVGNSSFRSVVSAEDGGEAATDDDGFLSAGEMSDARSSKGGGEAGSHNRYGIPSSPSPLNLFSQQSSNSGTSDVSTLRKQLERANALIVSLQERLDDAEAEFSDIDCLELRLDRLRESATANSCEGATLSPLSPSSAFGATRPEHLPEVELELSPQRAPEHTTSEVELLVLLTSQTSSNETRSAQEAMLRLFEALRLIYTHIDGSEAENLDQRAALWEVSQRRAIYPQAFSRNTVTGLIQFLGDWPTIERHNETNAELHGLDELFAGLPRQGGTTAAARGGRGGDLVASLRADTVAANAEAIAEVDNEDMSPAGEKLLSLPFVLADTQAFAFAKAVIQNAPLKPKGLAIKGPTALEKRVTNDPSVVYKYSFETRDSPISLSASPKAGSRMLRLGTATRGGSAASGPRRPPPGPPPPAAEEALESRSMAIWGKFFENASRGHDYGPPTELELVGPGAATALAQAVSAGDSASVERLLLSGASAASMAVLPDSSLGAYPLVAIHEGGGVKVSVGSCAGMRFTPLHVAVALGDMSMLSQLAYALDSQVSSSGGEADETIDALDEQGATPLLIAGCCALAAATAGSGDRGHNACIEFLLGSAAVVRGTPTVTGVKLVHIVDELGRLASTGNTDAHTTHALFTEYLQ